MWTGAQLNGLAPETKVGPRFKLMRRNGEIRTTAEADTRSGAELLRGVVVRHSITRRNTHQMGYQPVRKGGAIQPDEKELGLLSEAYHKEVRLFEREPPMQNRHSEEPATREDGEIRKSGDAKVSDCRSCKRRTAMPRPPGRRYSGEEMVTSISNRPDQPMTHG